MANVRILDVSPASIICLSSRGVETIRIEQLSTEWMDRFNYTAEAAAAADAELEQRSDAWAKQVEKNDQAMIAEIEAAKARSAELRRLAAEEESRRQQELKKRSAELAAAREDRMEEERARQQKMAAERNESFSRKIQIERELAALGTEMRALEAEYNMLRSARQAPGVSQTMAAKDSLYRMKSRRTAELQQELRTIEKRLKELRRS